MTDNEIAKEIAKNKADEIIAKKELDLAKQQLINDLNNGLGQEIKINAINKPIRIKKPFKIKIREFFEKFNKTLGN
jgi:hypothetical protein